MKIKYYFLAVFAIVLSGVSMVSCSDDDLSSTIFDTTVKPLDRTSATFALDTFCVENFLQPYNMRYLYKMEDISTNMNKNFVPATYDKSVEMAVLAKYLWFDVYRDVMGEQFLKKYSPRLLHIVGSGSYSNSGQLEEGSSEGGLKITMYKVNSLDVNNIDSLNKHYFNMMHREFASVLTSKAVTPTAFPLITASTYNPAEWQNAADSVVAGQGYVSPRASGSFGYDWVELMSNYIIRNQQSWDKLMQTAEFDWEMVEVELKPFMENFNFDKDNPIYKSHDDKDLKPGVMRDTLGYYVKDGLKDNAGTVKKIFIVRKDISRDASGAALLEDGMPVFLNKDNTVGRDLIMQKLDMLRTWLSDNFGINLDELRNEVQRKQYVTNPDGTFVVDSDGKFVNRLLAPSEEDPSRTLLEVLLDGVYKYDDLKNPNN